MQSDPREVPRNLLALKSLVIGMAVLLIVAAVILVGVGISRLSNGTMSGGKGFDPASLPLAAGCQLGAVTVSGDRLVIPVMGRDDCRKVILVDMESGRVRGEIAFPPP
jgi:hypothetical protein